MPIDTPGAGDQPRPDTAPTDAAEGRPWGAGAATGVGSLPYDDPLAAARLVFDEAPDFPHVPELPGRGAGADMIGRGAALLAEIHVDLQPAGWRVVERPGVDERRALDFLRRDLDAVEEVASGYAGPLKTQVAGPLTLAAAIELSRGGAALGDAGAVRDIAAALAEGVAGAVADLAGRVPGARIVVQVDEPSLPAVLAGRVPSASGFATLRALDGSVARERVGEVVAAIAAAGATPVVHCCAADPPIELLVRAGADAVSIDAAVTSSARLVDAVGEAVERGVDVFLGLVPARGPGAPPTTRDVAAPARRLWSALGQPVETLAERVVVTPACGLAGASDGWTHQAYRLSRQVARALVEAPEEDRAR